MLLSCLKDKRYPAGGYRFFHTYMGLTASSMAGLAVQIPANDGEITS